MLGFVLTALLCAPGISLATRAGGELWDTQLAEAQSTERRVRGLGVVALVLEVPTGKGDLSVAFDTDTLDLKIDRVPLTHSVFLGLRARAEHRLAGLLPDFVREGVEIPALGFAASYVEGAASVKGLAGRVSFEYELVARHFTFAPLPKTAPTFDLPDATTLVTNRFRSTLWAVEPDPSLEEAHRTRPRVVGITAGLELDVVRRTRATAWGPRDEEGKLLDTRNTPGVGLITARHWLRAGTRLTSDLRVQLEEWAGTGSREDDLTRVRVGGMAPYFVPLAGAPWVSFLATSYAATRAAIVTRVLEESEVGLAVGGVAVDDFERTGASDPGFALAAELFVDLRFGPWQVDAAVGHTELLDRSEWPRPPVVAVWGSVGRVFGSAAR
ncbi:MAG: hypothetical protein HYV07_14855 [Deltaproteobacteria bacterium]|nr:hypothetical protein [Deltaproteobacteria bacterium]